MYTCAGKEESDARKELFIFYPALVGKDVFKVELNEAYDNSNHREQRAMEVLP